MAIVAALPSNKRRKMGLPPPCFYNDLYSSYRVEWEARKRKFPPFMEVSSLCYVPSDSSTKDDSPALLLVGMTNGFLSIFQQFGQRSQSEEEVLDQQVAKGGEVGESDMQKDGDEESFGWKLVGSIQLGGSALTFLHATSSPEYGSVVLVGSVDGLWWWNSLKDLLQTMDYSGPHETKMKKSAGRSSKTQTFKHNCDISIAKAEAKDSDIFFATPKHKLYHIEIATLMAAVAKKSKSDCITEIPMPDSDSTSDTSLEVTTLHLTAARNLGSGESSSSSLLIGTNQSKVLCWDVQKESFSEPLTLSDVSSSTFENDSGGEASIRVTAIASIQPDWWTIAGTIVPPPSKAAAFRRWGHKRPVNFLGTWHGPSQSRTQLVSNIPERIQGLFGASSKLYSIGNLPTITVWESPYQLNRLHQIRTNAKSNNVICRMHQDTLAVAGVGSKVDLVQSAVRLQSLHLLQSDKPSPKGGKTKK